MMNITAINHADSAITVRPQGLDADQAARLIAAAPDMLDALSEIVAEWDARHADEDHRTGYTPDTNGIRMARAAIARATGKA